MNVQNPEISEEIISKLEEISEKVDHLLLRHVIQVEEVDCHGHECAASSCS